MVKQWIAPLAVLVGLGIAAPAAHAQEYEGLAMAPFEKLDHPVTNVKLGDLDGDGIKDFVLASNCRVTTLKGDRNGNYGNTGSMRVEWRQLSFGVGACDTTQSDLALGDVTGDGRLDVLLTRADRADLLVWRNRGDGTFQTAWIESLPAPAVELVTGDLDGNGSADLVVRTVDGAVVVRRTVNETFLAPELYDPGFDTASSLGIGNLGGGAGLDVVVGGDSGVRTLYGDGAGALTAGPLTVTHTAPQALVVLPLRNSGLDDVIVSGASVQPLYSNPSGPPTVGAAQASSVGGPVAAGDFDVDGDVDLLTVGGNADGVPTTGYLPGGDGALGAERLWTFTGEPGPLTDVQVTDTDGDGDADGVAVTEGRLVFLVNLATAKAAAKNVDLGTVAIGAMSAPKTLTFVNTGIRPFFIPMMSGPSEVVPSFFPIADACSQQTLPAGGTCTMTVVFTPHKVGPVESGFGLNGSWGGADVRVTGTGTAAPPAPDKTAPKPTSKVAKGKLKTVLSRGLKVTVGCDEACSVKGSLRLKGKQVAKGSAKGKTLTLKFTKAAKRSLAKRKSVKLTLRLTATDAAGNTRTTDKTFTVRR